MSVQQKITTCLWFEDNAEKAANHYVSIFKNSRIVSATPVLTVFELEGQRFTALNGRPPKFKFNESISLSVSCETQAEIDGLWQKLSSGGEESRCGWLKDQFGVSWQIVPASLGELLFGKDREGSERAMKALLEMNKLDIDRLQQAYRGT